jgi:hypothetical protein
VSAEYCERKWCKGQNPHERVTDGYGHVCGRHCPHHRVATQVCAPVSTPNNALSENRR